MATNVVVIGPPGSGKGTRISHAERVVPGLVSISMGNLLRKKNKNSSTGELVSDDIVMQILKEELSTVQGNIIIFDGVPRTINQAEMMEKYGIKVDVVISLSLTDEIAIKRAENRIICSNPDCGRSYSISGFKIPKKQGICDKCGAHLTKRADDNAETVVKRLQIYREKTEPLLQYYKQRKIPVRVVLPEDKNLVFIRSFID